MRLVHTRQLCAGARLARSIYSDQGTVLLGKGVELSERMIKRLQALDITSVYIQDKLTDDISPYDVLSEATRCYAVSAVHETMTKLIDSHNINKMMISPDLGKKFRDVIKAILAEIRSSKDVLLGLSNIYAKDGYLYHHSVNVAVSCLAVGTSIGLNQNQLLELGIGAILHDIGKTRLPMDILNKPGKLTAEEWELVYKHPEWGFEMLKENYDISLLSAHMALQHHEKEDGSGYPRKLTGDKMHLYGKIAAIADVYEALTAVRAYKPPYPPHEALEYIMANGGRHFNFDLVQVFCKHVAPYPVGTTVRLSSGETGIVAKISPANPTRPVVRVFANEANEQLPSAYEIDLFSNLSLVITSSTALQPA